MSKYPDSVVSVNTTGPNLPDGVLGIADLPDDYANGCRVFVHYNGPTEQLRE